MCQEDPLHAPQLFYLLHKDRVEAGRVHHHIPLWANNEIGGTSKGLLRVPATVVNPRAARHRSW
jgi:hypothetical protein